MEAQNRKEFLLITRTGGSGAANKLVHELIDVDFGKIPPVEVTDDHRAQIAALAADLEAKGETDHAAAIRSLVEVAKKAKKTDK